MGGIADGTSACAVPTTQDHKWPCGRASRPQHLTWVKKTTNKPFGQAHIKTASVHQKLNDTISNLQASLEHSSRLPDKTQQTAATTSVFYTPICATAMKPDDGICPLQTPFATTNLQTSRIILWESFRQQCLLSRLATEERLSLTLVPQPAPHFAPRRLHSISLWNTCGNPESTSTQQTYKVMKVIFKDKRDTVILKYIQCIIWIRSALTLT